MNEMNELAKLRENTPAMTEHARLRGRNRLIDEIGGRRPRRRLAWRLAVTGGLAAVLGLAAIGYQIVGPPSATSAAEAATVLHQAAVAVTPLPGPAPRPAQFLYLEILHVTSGMRQRERIWLSADGSRPGLSTSEGFLGTQRYALPPYDPADGLFRAPYSVVAALPAEPSAMLRALYADPYVADQMRVNGDSREVAVWGLLRDLVQIAPPAQKAALFLAAGRIPGITYVRQATDAAGRTGEAVGLTDPRLGSIQFIFDRDTHAFLGERIVNPQNPADVRFNDTVQRTAVADKAGQIPRT